MLAIRPFSSHKILATTLALAACGAARDASAAQAAPKAAAAAPAAKAGPKYKEASFPDPTDWKLKKTTLMAEGKVSAETSKEDEATFDKHYKSLVYEFTQKAHESQLPKKRAELKRDLNKLGGAPDKSLHDRLLSSLSTTLPTIVKSDDCSPAARLNCLYAYGDLNSDEGDIRAQGVVPLASTLPALVGILKNKDDRFPVYLLPAALSGVSRHISDGALTQGQRRDIAQTLAGWLEKPPSQGTSTEAQNFLRLRAVELLRMLLAKGPEANLPEVAEALHTFAADEKVALEDRCDAVRAFGVLDSKIFPEKSTAEYVRTMAAIAAEIGRQSAVPVDPLLAGDQAAGDGALPGAQPEPGAAPQVVNGEAGNTPVAEGAAPEGEAGVENPAVENAVPLPVPVEAASDKSQLALSPEHQWLFLQCIAVGIVGSEPGRRCGLDAAPMTDEGKQLLVDLKAKVGKMITIVKRKKKDEKLNDTELRDMQSLATELEAMIHMPGGNGKSEQARAESTVALDPRAQPGAAAPAPAKKGN